MLIRLLFNEFKKQLNAKFTKYIQLSDKVC